MRKRRLREGDPGLLDTEVWSPDQSPFWDLSTLCPEAGLTPPLIVIQLLVIFWYQLILILQLVYGDVVLLLIYLMCKSIRTLAWPSPWKVIKSNISGVKCYLTREWQSRCLM